MTVNQLACFLAVAECNSFTHAADQLYISHSAVSKAISALEDSLGVQLLKRDKQSVSMTEAGKELYEKGKHVYHLWLDLEQRISRMNTRAYGSISILTPVPYCYQMMLVYRQLRLQYPRITLDIQYGDSFSIYKAVKQGHVDFGITFSFFWPREDDSVAHIPLFEDEFVAVVPPNHRLSYLSSTDADTVLMEPQVFPPLAHNPSGVSTLKAIQRPIEEWDFQARNMEELLLQISLGTGCSILPRSAVEHHHGVCEIIPLSDPQRRFSQILLWRKDRLTPAMEQFINRVRAQFSESADE